MKHKLATLVIVLLIHHTFLQGHTNDGTPNQQITNFDLLLEVNSDKTVSFFYVFEKGATMYSLAKNFMLSVEEIYKYNKLESNAPIQVGSLMRLPLSKKNIDHAIGDNGQSSTTRVFYKVKKGDTLFGLTSIFLIESAHLTKLNPTIKNGLQAGEMILIGYYKVPQKKGSNKEYTIKNEGPIKNEVPPVKEVTTNKETLIINEKEDLNLKPEKIIKIYQNDLIGWCDNLGSEGRNNFVLHNEAPIGSTLDLYNPMLRSRTKAKVIGRIPDYTYNNDIQIILNGTTAKSLGILDQRFKINVKYTYEQVNE